MDHDLADHERREEDVGRLWQLLRLPPSPDRSEILEDPWPGVAAHLYVGGGRQVPGAEPLGDRPRRARGLMGDSHFKTMAVLAAQRASWDASAGVSVLASPSIIGFRNCARDSAFEFPHPAAVAALPDAFDNDVDLVASVLHVGEWRAELLAQRPPVALAVGDEPTDPVGPGMLLEPAGSSR